eukprot:CAMPEP_0115832772 /NCGR_PEP_ID=MMETSP0287-20121206/2831_1 /TAXON_ID=412157 /ORGANISM="Chrysochromulina rotalis, Strain UIO044" /LENGTH=481 /DNA_ID=CAMNT_0003286169 /DNA_START=39 /DNA_END=1484 /DNA_ORIENTATION=-
MAQFRVLWISGHVHGATPIWREGLSEWQTISQCAEVADVLKSLPQPPPPPADLWYYLDAGGRQRGGVTAEQMGMLLRRGEVDGLTTVWRLGMTAWKELSNIEELRAQLVCDDDDDDDGDHAEVAFQRAQEVAFDPEMELSAPSARSLKPLSAAAATSSSYAASTSSGEASGMGDAPAAAVKPKRVRPNKKGKFKADGGSNVYVSGLSEDANEDEIAEAFKVAGLLKTDLASGAPRIRLYRSPDGRPKGDALVSFLKAESVALAVTLRDGFEMRPGRAISVQPARFERREGEAPKRLSKDEAVLRKKQRLLELRSLAEWEDGLGGGKRSATVVLTGLFDREADAEADADFYANLRQDVEVECKKAGEVEKVTVFEGSEKGAAAVRFKQVDDAERCVAMMNNRQFGQGTVRCELYDGVTDYRSLALQHAAAHGVRGGSGNGTAPILDSASGVDDIEEQERNLDEFGDWLEAGSTDEEPDGSDD